MYSLVMNNQEDTSAPLLAVRQRLDNTLTAYLDKVVALWKRRDAVNAAIEIVRAADDEIMKLPTLAAKNDHKPRVIRFDAGAVEARVVQVVSSGETSLPQIRTVLEAETIPYTISGLKAILRTSPKIERLGERDQTRYRLRA